MTEWNFADVWQRIADAQPDAPAIIQGERVVSWGDFDDTASRLASWFDARGLSENAKVAMYLYNCPEYLIAFYASLLGGYVPVNTNYRYEVEELTYLFDNSDAEALIFHGTFTDKVGAIRDDLPTLTEYVWLDDGTHACPSWATPFTEASGHDVRALRPRTADDLIFLYTGGTTGMPKGVMWRQDDLFGRLLPVATWGPDPTIETAVTAAAAGGKNLSLLPACPLMHGTGLFSCLTALSGGSSIVLLTKRHYDPLEMVSEIDRLGVSTAVIVGDPFARPWLRVLDENPQKYSMATLFAVVSSGAMWSEEIKRGLLAHHPNMLLVDAFSSSEALGMGRSISTGSAPEKTARFELGDDVRVVNDDLVDVVAGTDEIGKLALGGRNPLGYYKDEAKTDATFKIIDGKRFTIPGDMARVNADGTIQLLGRGSQCINSGGEKIFPEEVEETLKMHVAVADACVVGVANENYGQIVVAAVELHPGLDVDEATLIAHVKGHLASYKAPRAIRMVDTIGRAPNGKMDYARHQREAAEWMAERAQVT